MKRKHLLLSCSFVVAVLAGCGGSAFESKKIDYKSAGKLPPLEVPPDLTRPARDDRYAVPDVNPKGQATWSAYVGDRAGQTRTSTAQEVLPDVGGMRIERAGSQRWLVVPGTPEKLWPAVKEFWQDLGFIVDVERPEVGIMETDWAENRAKIPQDIIRSAIGKVFDNLYSTPERDKFRTRLDKGTRPDTTEIYISHRGMYEIYVNEGRTDTRWQPRPADPELEAEMLRRLMVRLGMDEVRAKAALAEAAEKNERARIVATADGRSVLEMQEAFDRAWRRVGLALDRVGFTVEDRDRSQGLYYVRYVDPEIEQKKGGWFSGWGRDKTDPAKRPQYRIHVAAAGDDTRVQVQGKDGAVEESDTAKKILRLLHEQLK